MNAERVCCVLPVSEALTIEKFTNIPQHKPSTLLTKAVMLNTPLSPVFKS